MIFFIPTKNTNRRIYGIRIPTKWNPRIITNTTRDWEDLLVTDGVVGIHQNSTQSLFTCFGDSQKNGYQGRLKCAGCHGKGRGPSFTLAHPGSSHQFRTFSLQSSLFLHKPKWRSGTVVHARHFNSSHNAAFLQLRVSFDDSNVLSFLVLVACAGKESILYNCAQFRLAQAKIMPASSHYANNKRNRKRVSKNDNDDIYFWLISAN